jgi:cell division septation protein DedD
MPDDDFNFDDNDKGGDNDFALDDFFGGEQKDEEGAKSGSGGPSIDDFFGSADASEGSEESLPMDRDEVMDVPPSAAERREAPAPDPFASDTPEEAAPAEPDFSEERTEPPPDEYAGEEAEEAEGGGFLSRNWLLLVIAVLVVLVVGSGGFLGYTYLFGNGGDSGGTKATAALTDKDKDKGTSPDKADKKINKAAAGKVPAPAGKSNDKKDKKSADKKTPQDKTKTADKKSTATASVKPPSPKDKDQAKQKDSAKPPDKPDRKPPEKSASSGHQAVASTGGAYTVQVASYMMDASKKHPEKELKKLGYNDYHYVKEYRRLWIYDVYAGKGLSRKEARELVEKIEDMGYAPRLEREGPGYSVLVYSYGSKSVANSTRRKLSKAGIKSVRVNADKKKVGLDQLRVGHFSSRYQARKAQRDLRRNGFRSAYVLKE